MGVLDFLERAQSLKRIPRSGWISRGVRLDHVESVAEHTFSTSVIAMILAELLMEQGERVDELKVLKMALLHDIGESLTFDIDRRHVEEFGELGRRLKVKIEAKAIEKVLSELSPRKSSREYQKMLTKELLEGKTIESKIVNAADRLDLLLQTIDYEKVGYSKKVLESLWNDTESRLYALNLPAVSSLVEELKRRRSSLTCK